jgi:hypothetical protein
MLHPETLATVCHCRQELYGCQDSFFELTDAVLTGTERTPLARLSLGPAFRRRWPSSTCDALADNTAQLVPREPRAACRRRTAAVGAGRPALAPPGRAHQPRARLRAACRHRPASRWGRASLAYQGLVAVPEAHGSWVLPLDVRRCGPSVGLPASLAIGQRQAAVAEHAAEAARPVVPLDPSYDASVPAQAHLPADLLVRLAKRCRFFRC